jgi:hypothetical protein
MDLLEIFLQHENVHLYQDIENVMSVMVKAALLINAESIVEFWIRNRRCCFIKTLLFLLMDYFKTELIPSKELATLSEGVERMKTTECPKMFTISGSRRLRRTLCSDMYFGVDVRLF